MERDEMGDYSQRALERNRQANVEEALSGAVEV